MPSSTQNDKCHRRRLSALTDEGDDGSGTAALPDSSPKRLPNKRSRVDGALDGGEASLDDETYSGLASSGLDDNLEDEELSEPTSGLRALRGRAAKARGETGLSKDRLRYLQRYGDMAPQKVLGEFIHTYRAYVEL